MQIGQVYQDAVCRLKEAGIAEAEIEAALLLGRLLDCTRSGLFIRAKEAFPAGQHERLHGMLSRRLAREPLAYILGEQEFWSLPFAVGSEVLVPRPETEELLERVFAQVKALGLPDGPALDLGVGSGVITVVLAFELRDRLVIGVDRSLAALRLAAKNAARHRVADRVLLLNSDWLSAVLEERQFSLVVSNPPYIAEAAMDSLEPEVRDFEPRLALVGGADGLSEIRRLAGQVHRVMRPGGLFVMEIGADQADAARAILGGIPEYERVQVHLDLAGRARILEAWRR